MDRIDLLYKGIRSIVLICLRQCSQFEINRATFMNEIMNGNGVMNLRSNAVYFFAFLRLVVLWSVTSGDNIVNDNQWIFLKGFYLIKF